MRKNKEMENISFFLNAAEKYGVGKADLFQVGRSNLLNRFVINCKTFLVQ